MQNGGWWKIVTTKMKDKVHNRKHYNYLCRKIKKHSKATRTPTYAQRWRNHTYKRKKEDYE